MHAAAIVQNLFAAHAIQRLKQLPYLLNLAPTVFFLCINVKEIETGQSFYCLLPMYKREGD